MEELKRIKEQLIGQVQAQMSNLPCVDAQELGEVIDMIKDLEEAMYYCTIIEAMEANEEYSTTHYYDDKYSKKYPKIKKTVHHPVEDDIEEWDYYEREYEPILTRDSREGKSPQRRKMYMESKALHKDKTTQLKELDKYIQDLSSDIVEMIEDASDDERAYLEKKISALATKIGQMNG